MEARLFIGRRVALRREALGLTHGQVAEAVGRDAAWLRSVESGSRRLDRYTMVHALAEALGADPADLLGRPGGAGDPHTRAADLALPALRRALLRGQSDTGPTADADVLDRVGGPAGPDDLRRRTDEADRLRRDGRHDRLARDLPSLLDDLRAAAAVAPEADRAAVHQLLAEAAHAAAVLAKRLGHPDLAALAAAESARAAAVTGDPVAAAAVQWLRAEICAAAGATAEADRLVASGLDRTDPLLGRAPGAWSVWGTLHLVGAVLAAQRGSQADSAPHLGEAATAADRAGAEPRHQTDFCAAEHAVHAVHAGLELGGDTDLLDAVANAPLGRLPAARRARHGIDRARAQARAGDDTAAVRELLAADRLAPQVVRAHPMAAETVLAAVRRSRGAGPVREAADRLGIPY
ncbi:helix-turn-helix domain-containing protein [Kitasatospora sp. NPDC059571]|uniref:helix-turn-helix domain-containing protein n=1 Tax=Kitasatospora sp. NPDC059571 TaxID=3346871 RepID=UPI00369E627F